jgi:outer membrane receptor protein involved in Fe transport
MHVRSVLLRASLSLIFLSAVQFSPAQTSKGILAGVVRDTSGAAVPNASVTVTSEETGETRTIKSDGQGAYRADGINPGLYLIHVEETGFSSADVKDVKVSPSVTSTYDVKLTVGSANETVTVEAVTNSINTENGQLSGTVDAIELGKVPIFSLNPFELIATLPGVQLINPSLNLGGIAGNYEQLTVNGARPRTNNYLLDGQDINDVGIGGQSFNPEVPDMYQSTTALLNSSSAEYGRSGGAVVNLITKAGSNQFHGSAFELYSGSGLNALDGVTREGKPFPAGSANPKARYDQHQYGFTAGGPLWKDKLFAFGGTQFTRFYGKSTSGQIELPDAAGYALLTSIGKLSPTAATQVALLQGLLNGGSYLTSYTLLQDNVKPLNVSAALCPGGTSCTVQTGYFQRPPVSQQEPDTQWMYRIDFIPRSTDTFTFRYLHDRESFTPDLGLNTSGLPGFDGLVGGPTELAQGTWTHVLTPHLVNEFRTSEVRLNTQFGPTPETLANPLAKSFNVTLSGSGLPALGVSQNIPQGRIQELYQFQDTVGWTIGRQSLRMGVDVGRDHETDLIAQNALGGLTIAQGGGASSLDNFLQNRLGTSGTATKTFGPTRVDPHLWKLAGFIQDDVKLSPELTINLGVRYDYDTNPENALPYPGVDPNNPYVAITTVLPVRPDKNNIAPRLGFAYNPHSGFFHDGKTVFHGGLGIFYDTDFTNILINAAQSAPVAASGTQTSTATGGLTNATGQLALITSSLGPQSSVQSVANNLVNPLTYQYNFGMERELPAQVKLTLNYVGAHGEKLFSNRQLNYFQGPGLGRLNSTRGVINIRDNRADSNYNSAQVEVSRRFTKGFFFRASYAYAKNLDDASEVFATFASPTSYSANLAGNGLYQDYGPSAFDRRHVASFEYVYSPMGFHSQTKALDLMLSAFTRHFAISGTTQFSSGPYSTFNNSGLDTNGDGSTANDRPLIGNASAPITTAAIDGANLAAFGIGGGIAGTYYDLAKLNDANTDIVPINPSSVHFLVPGGPTVQKGIGRNSFENPGQSFWNLALEKDIPAGFKRFENGQFVLRAEGQNVGNHNNVSTLDINVLDVGTTSYLNKSAARESTYQNFRLWAKFVF